MFKVRLSEETRCHDGLLTMNLVVDLPFPPWIGLVLFADASGADSVISRVAWDVNESEFLCDVEEVMADCPMESVAKTNAEYGWETIS